MLRRGRKLLLRADPAFLHGLFRSSRDIHCGTVLLRGKTFWGLVARLTGLWDLRHDPALGLLWGRQDSTSRGRWWKLFGKGVLSNESIGTPDLSFLIRLLEVGHGSAGVASSLWSGEVKGGAIGVPFKHHFRGAQDLVECLFLQDTQYAVTADAIFASEKPTYVGGGDVGITTGEV